MAVTFKEYSEKLKKYIDGVEKIIDARLKEYCRSDNLSGIIKIYGDDIKVEMLDLIKHKYISAGWLKVYKDKGFCVFEYDRSVLSFITVKEGKKKETVTATKSRPIKITVNREVDDGILTYDNNDDDVPF